MAADTDIAIIGLALRVPGAADPEHFWRNVREGVESVQHYSERELREAGVSAAELADPNYVRAGAPLADMEAFDAEFFGFGPQEAAIMDPQHRQFLECSWEALERAGHVPSRFEGSIGVFAGCGMGAYFANNILSHRELLDTVGLFLLRHTGNDKDFLATRVAYCLDLHGPSLNVQTACSTSLVAAHLACQSLLCGECDLALAGGVTIELPHRQGYVYKSGEILSPDGHCRPFDHRAQGTLFGSGAGVVVLRRLSDALADHDPIVAVIKGSAVNNDGARKVGYLAPSVDGQAAAVTEALNVAGVEPESIGLIECHGTGTAMGDPIEVAALTQAFGTSGSCALGSIKSNIGHLDTAAGVVGLIKAALALQHAELPPSLNYEQPNPQIAFEDTPFYVNAKLAPWPAGAAPRRAAVNSLGVGGTNAFVVLEEAPARAAPPRAAAQIPRLLALSARNRRSLAEQRKRLASYWRAHPELRIDDVAYTLFRARDHFTQRAVLIASDRESALALLEDDGSSRVYAHSAREAASPVFMFPGGGAQYPRMAAGLYASEPLFREHMERGLRVLASEHGLDLRSLWLPAPAELEDAARTLERPSLQLPLLFLVEYALAQCWLARGVKPAALIGHSLGENTAACVAGVLSFEAALGLVVLRGRLFETLPDGGMLSVPLPASELEALLPAGVVVACENAPKLSVASGTRSGLLQLSAALAERGIEAQPIRIRIAAHSPLLEPILAEFGAYLRSVRLSPPRIPIISNVTGEPLRDDEAVDPEYWVRHLRSCVRFARGIAWLERRSDRVYLEVGPGRALGSLVRQCVADPQQQTPIASLRRPDEVVDDASFFAGALGRLWASGLAVELGTLLPEQAARRIELPAYAFDHKPYFIAPGERAAASGKRSAELRDWLYRGVWRWRELEPEEREMGREQTYLVFADRLGVADHVGRQLRALGQRVVFVRKSGAYGQTDLFEYEVAPHASHGYATLVQELAASEKLPDRILHLWCLDALAAEGSEWSYDSARREAAFDSVFHLARALAAEGVSKDVQLVVFTSGAQRVLAEPLPNPEHAMAHGLCRVVARELPGVRAQAVDLPLPRRARVRWGAPALQNFAELTAAVLAEAHVARASGSIAYRESRRFELALEPAPPPPSAGSGRLRERGVYAITGGLGGIGLTLAKHLAQQYHARLLLIGRHLPRDAAQLRAEIEALGGELELGAADVAEIDAVRAVFERARQRFGRVHGVFHAAGVLDDALLGDKSLADAERVLRPKLEGTWVLHRVAREADVELLVLFSSTSAWIAPPGQTDYVAANAFLNAYAESRQGLPGPRTVALQWGVWRDVGMAVAALAGPKPAAHDGVVLASMHSAAEHWWLDEHRLAGGVPLMPGTGFLQLMAASAPELGVPSAFELCDADFVLPLVVEQPVRVELCAMPVDGGQQLEIRSQAGSHALARLTALPGVAPEPLDLASLRARCSARRLDVSEGSAGPQASHLRFGPRFHCLRKVYFGAGEALGELRLAPAFTGDTASTPLHAALLDIGTGFGLWLAPDYLPEQGLWAPLEYARLRWFAPLPAACVAWVRCAPGQSAASGTLRLDATLCDASGSVCVEVEGLGMRRVPAGFESALRSSAAPSGKPPSAAELAARKNLEGGIAPHEGGPALEIALRALPGAIVLSPIDPRDQARQLDASLAAPGSAGKASWRRPELDVPYAAPEGPVESELAQVWGQLLGVDGVGRNDDFFALGGHSLIAVRLSAEVRKRFGVDLPLSALFEASTIERLAKQLPEPQAAESRGRVLQALRPFTPLVSIKPSGSARPLFCVAGQGGNPMHLRSLAQYLGAERPFYGLQHRGLDGRSAPYASVEEMAGDFVRHIRELTPGPYLIAGYSGGGTAAFEMARQLTAAGCGVDGVILLDSFCPVEPELSVGWRLRVHLDGLRKEGPAYARRRIVSRLSRYLRHGHSAVQQSRSMFEIAASNWQAIENRYRPQPLPAAAYLFRVQSEDDNDARYFAERYGGWNALFTLSVQQHVVPGTHVSMCEEPNVQVLAQKLRQVLDGLDATARAAQ